MIDTDKYKGHLAHLDYELWAFTDFMNINATHEERRATDALLNDAPLLLAEVKRLRRVLEDIESMIPDNHEEVSPILSDILSECHRVLPIFNEVIEC